MEYTTSTVNPKVNCGLWVIMRCPCRFTLVKKRTTLVSDVDNAQGDACEGSREDTGNLCISLTILL